MEIHGLRPEFQPESINTRAKQTQEVNTQVDRPVRGHDDVVPPVNNQVASTRLLDVRA